MAESGAIKVKYAMLGIIGAILTAALTFATTRGSEIERMATQTKEIQELKDADKEHYRTLSDLRGDVREIKSDVKWLRQRWR